MSSKPESVALLGEGKTLSLANSAAKRREVPATCAARLPRRLEGEDAAKGKKRRRACVLGSARRSLFSAARSCLHKGCRPRSTNDVPAASGSHRRSSSAPLSPACGGRKRGPAAFRPVTMPESILARVKRRELRQRDMATTRASAGSRVAHRGGCHLKASADVRRCATRPRGPRRGH